MLEQALQTWRDWQLPLVRPPLVIEELHGGKTNRSFLCVAGEQKVVLRLNSPLSHQLGINRQHERQILQRLQGLAPELFFFNDDILVTGYLEGRCWTREDLQNRGNQTRLIAVLETVHQHELQLPAFDYLRHAEHYWQMLCHSRNSIPEQLQQRREIMLPLLREFQQQAIPRVLCHHDLVPANIIECDGVLRLLDWEYAGMGFADFDRAVIAAEGVEGVEIKEVVRLVYQYICELWTALHGPHTV
jgi:thiamine kinase